MPKVVAHSVFELGKGSKVRLTEVDFEAAMTDDSVLDDALDDFRSTAHVSPTPAELDSSRDNLHASDPTTVPHRAAATAASASAPSRPVAFDPLGPTAGSASRKAAFDPLKKRTKQPAGASAARSRASSKGTSQVPATGAPAPPAAPASQPAAVSDTNGAINEDLARGVAQLMADLAKADSEGGGGGEDQQRTMPHEREIASTLAALAAAAPAGAAHAGAPAGGDEPVPGTSQLHRLAEQLAAGGVPGGADASDESFASLADTIMQQLLSKDVLHQPMRDIGDKYPAWLAARRESLPAEELQRYEAQYKYIRQICALYENDPSNFSKLFTLIQEMQACGQPPTEIVQDLAPGLSCGEDGLPHLPTAGDNCTIS